VCDVGDGLCSRSQQLEPATGAIITVRMVCLKWQMFTTALGTLCQALPSWQYNGGTVGTSWGGLAGSERPVQMCRDCAGHGPGFVYGMVSGTSM
jgi:hypothetical protein